jgi:hypothetical protein
VQRPLFDGQGLCRANAQEFAKVQSEPKVPIALAYVRVINLSFVLVNYSYGYFPTSCGYLRKIPLDAPQLAVRRKAGSP